MKIQRNFTIDKEVVEHAKNNPLIKSFSDWIVEKYREEFFSTERLVKRLEELKKEEEYLRKQIQESKNHKGKSLFSERELNWLKNEGLKRLKKTTFEGVYKYFITEFDRGDINRRQFNLVVKQLEGKNE